MDCVDHSDFSRSTSFTSFFPESSIADTQASGDALGLAVPLPAPSLSQAVPFILFTDIAIEFFFGARPSLKARRQVLHSILLTRLPGRVLIRVRKEGTSKEERTEWLTQFRAELAEPGWDSGY